MSQLNFDATSVTPQQPLEPVPSGWYIAAMSDSELVPTADGQGMRLKYELTILDGQYKGRKVFDGFNIKNANPQAQEIAAQQLSALCHGVGRLRIQSSEELHNLPVGVKVSFEPARADANDPAKMYDARNQVKGFKPAVEVSANATTPSAAPAAAAPAWAAKPTAAPAAAAPVASPAPASTVTPPWLAGKAAPAAPATPAADVSAAPKRGPKKKTAVERRFFVYIDDNNMPLKSESEVAAMIAQGMPADTMIAIKGTEDWKTPMEYSVVAAPAAPAAAAPTPAAAANVPPWQR